MIPMFVDRKLQQFLCNHCQRTFYIPSKYTDEGEKFFLKDNFGCPYCHYDALPKVGIFLREFTIKEYGDEKTINFINPERRKEYSKEEDKGDEEDE